MRFMNEYDIRWASDRTNNIVVSRAIRFIDWYKDEVNQNSDGWAYWAPPVRAAANLMALIEDIGDAATEKDYTKALAPIKAFYTRRGYAAGMKFPEVD